MKQQLPVSYNQWTSSSYTPRGGQNSTLTSKDSYKRLNYFANAIKQVSRTNLQEDKKPNKVALYTSRLPQRLLNYRLKRTLSQHASQDDLKQPEMMNHTVVQYEQINSESDSEEHVNNLSGEPPKYYPRSQSSKMKPVLKNDLSQSYLSELNPQSSQKMLNSSTISTATRTQLMRNASQGTHSRKMDVQVSPYNSTLISPQEKMKYEPSFSKPVTRQISNRGYVAVPFGFRPKTSPSSGRNLKKQVQLKQQRGIFSTSSKSRSPPKTLATHAQTEQASPMGRIAKSFLTHGSSGKSPGKWVFNFEEEEPWKQDVKKLKALFASRNSQKNIEEYNKEIRKIKAQSRPTKKAMSMHGINKDLEEYKAKSGITQPERLNFRVLNNFIQKYSEKLCLINKKDKLAEAFASRNLASEGKLIKDDEKPISFHNCIDFAEFQNLKDYYQSLGLAPSKVFKNFRPTSIQKEMRQVGSRYMQSYERTKAQNRRKTPPRRHEPDDEDMEMIRMVKDIKQDIQKRSDQKQQSLEKILGIPRGSSQPRASIVMKQHTYGSSKAVTLNTNRSENCKKAFLISKECKKFIASNRLHQREFECIKGGTRDNFKEMHKAMDSTETLHRKQIIDRVQKVLDRLKEAKVTE